MSKNENELVMRVQSIIKIPELQRNIRGQVRAALDCLPLDSQKYLACSFSEHGLKIILSSDLEKLKVLMNGIRIIREFLNKETTIQQVRELTCKAIDLDTVEMSHEHGSSLTTGIAVSILMGLESFCCQRELVIAKLIIGPQKSPHDVFSIAKSICFAVGHHVGGSDWDSDDPTKKNIARNQGHKTSEEEAIWQREQILKYISK